jgi:hypothetical protein
MSLDLGSSQFANEGLPSSSLPPYTAAIFWDDMNVPAGSSTLPEGIFYEVDGAVMTFEWILSRAYADCEFYQFQLVYNSSVPGVFNFKYFVLGNNGQSASIGLQGVGNTSTDFVQYALYSATAVRPGLMVTCNTNTVQNCTTSTFTF